MIITTGLLGTISSIVLSKYATPVWGVVSGFLMFQLKSRAVKRDDFAVIRDSLYEEIDRIKQDSQVARKDLDESKRENEKCEARYFELATQHRELLKHCIFLTKEVKVLKQEVKDNKEQISINVRKARSDTKASDTPE